MEQKKKLSEKIREFFSNIVEKVKTDKKFAAILIGAVVAVVAVIVALVLLLGGNGSGNGGGFGSGGNDKGNKVTYSVSLKTIGGMALADVDVYVYADDSLKELKDFAKTNSEGQVTFQLAENDKYAIALSGVGKGYDVASSYSFSGTNANIVLTSQLITDEDLSTATLGVGDVMYDFTVTTSEGVEITLSEVLAEKKMVMLNFWYTTCSWCLTEFPIMGEAYEMYKDDIEIIALDPLDGAEAVKGFAASGDYPFPMADCPASWSTVFGISGYPTSVFIDRYGVICAVESGAITSLRPFACAFDHFTAEDYEQVLCANGVADLVTQMKPTSEMPSSEEIAAAINGSGVEITYRGEADDEYSWPFVITEFNGTTCIQPSNAGIEDSYAIIYADVYLEEGQAIGFDYWASCEFGGDIMYVIVNDEDIFQISGVTEDNKWASCYPWVATESGEYEVALCFLKDGDTNEADDTVYVKNMRIVDKSQIDTLTYIPREAGISADGFEFTYADIVYNEMDGYYHVGSKTGPLLLANLMNYSQFNEENSVYLMMYEDATLVVDGKECFDRFVDYCSYASNATINGLCTVTEELATFLKEIANIYGFDSEDENEWLRMCCYYEVYGPNAVQLEDPIKGLSTFSAYKAVLGTNVSTNFFYYDRAIIPRGMFAEFIPTTSGVYRFTSHSESADGVEAWVFDENGEMIYTYNHDERMYGDMDNCSIVYYMEAGTPYYINYAFWDVYHTGYIYYDVEYLGASYDLFRLASLGFFTYDSSATGDEMYHIIDGGIDVILKDGYYYEDLGKDANGNQKYGSLVYADFTGITGIFDAPIATNNGVTGLIDKGGFDFSKTEDDLYVIGILAQYNNDVEAADAYLRETWGDDYDAFAEEYKIEDVYEGIYHGKGEDYTDVIRGYLSKMDASGNVERNGCVAVTEELAEILQMLMEKYTFENVDNSWLKLCYYYDYLGPEK